MANRVPPTPHYADNSSGSLPAACIVWRRGDADSMSARDTYDPTIDAGYTTAGALPSGPQSIRLLLLLGESIYAELDPKAERRRPALKKGAAHEKPLGHGSGAALQE